jgi:hypothetical protein
VGLRRWATRQLQTGDLSALQDLKSGKPVESRSRIERLRNRGFVQGPAEKLRITAAGRIALIVRRLSMM